MTLRELRGHLASVEAARAKIRRRWGKDADRWPAEVRERYERKSGIFRKLRDQLERRAA